MELSLFHYDLLSKIKDNDFIPGTELQNLFPGQSERVKDIIHFLYDKNLIDATPQPTREKYYETIQLRETIKKQRLLFSPNYHLLLTESGEAVLNSFFDKKEYFALANKQLQILEMLAFETKNKADAAIEEVKLQKENTESLSSISNDAKSQADTARKELEVMKKELRFVENEAADTKLDSQFSRKMSVAALIVSIISIIVQVKFG